MIHHISTSFKNNSLLIYEHPPPFHSVISKYQSLSLSFHSSHSILPLYFSSLSLLISLSPSSLFSSLLQMISSPFFSLLLLISLPFLILSFSPPSLLPLSSLYPLSPPCLHISSLHSSSLSSSLTLLSLFSLSPPFVFIFHHFTLFFITLPSSEAPTILQLPEQKMHRAAKIQILKIISRAIYTISSINVQLKS